jgi:hypothetical protein
MLQVFIIGPVLQIRMAEAIIRKMWMEPFVVHDFDRIMNINIFLLYKNDGLPIHLTRQLESNLIAKQIRLQVRCFGAEPKKKNVILFKIINYLYIIVTHYLKSKF